MRGIDENCQFLLSVFAFSHSLTSLGTYRRGNISPSLVTVAHRLAVVSGRIYLELALI